MIFNSFPVWLAISMAVASFAAFLGSLFAIEVSKRNGWGQSCPILSAGLSMVYCLLNVDAIFHAMDYPIASTDIRHYAWYGAQIATLGLIAFSIRGAYRTNEAVKLLRKMKGKLKTQ